MKILKSFQKSLRYLYLILFVSMLAGFNQQALANTLPNVYIIGTGGTIAGYAASSVSGNYQAGKVKTDEILKAIPDIKKIANVEVKDLFQIDSSDISIDQWIQLAKRIDQVAKNKNVNGIVVTHGTDTLEETAYFLNLVLKTSKPVVLVGAMRPSSSISADGSINLYNAIALAESKFAKGQGVLVVMNDQIYSSREVSKTDTTKVDAFKAFNTGPIGHINFGHINVYKSAQRKHTQDTPFNVDHIKALPKVEIVYEYAGNKGDMLKNAIDTKDIRGIVIAGLGNGNIPAPDRKLLKVARDKHIAIVRSSRTGSGAVSYDYVENLDSKLGLISADNLNPQKARILLMLALTKTDNPKVIQDYFSTY